MDPDTRMNAVWNDLTQLERSVLAGKAEDMVAQRGRLNQLYHTPPNSDSKWKEVPNVRT